MNKNVPITRQSETHGKRSDRGAFFIKKQARLRLSDGTAFEGVAPVWQTGDCVGEVACFGRNLEEAFYTSWLATEQQVKGKNIFISVPDEQKHKFVEEAGLLLADGWHIYTTEGTHKYFKNHEIKTTKLLKAHIKKEPSVATYIEKRKLDLMINVPHADEINADAYTIRRLAIDNHVPLITNAETGRLLLRCLADANLKTLEPRHWQEYVPNNE